jgi:hypothetical protein
MLPFVPGVFQYLEHGDRRRQQASTSNYKSAASKTAATQSRKTRTRGDS